MDLALAGQHKNSDCGPPDAISEAFSHSSGRILVGDVRAMLRTLESESVHCVVTSPPYWSLRAYGTQPQVWGGDPDCDHAWLDPVTSAGISGGTNQGGKTDNPNGMTYRPVPPTSSSFCGRCSAWSGELGSEPTPELFVEHIVEVFREVRRVLRKDGTCWINLGDSYAANRSYQVTDSKHRDVGNSGAMAVPDGLKPKDLVGIPWMVAFALRADGWYLRQDLIWNKPAAMPESVQDRCTKSHEYVFLLSKSARYYFDAEAIREPGVTTPEQARSKWGAWRNGDAKQQQRGESYHGGGQPFASDPNPNGRNKRSVWTINTEPTTIQHFATWPEKLVEPMILAGSPEGGVVLDPFLGSGTTGRVATRLGRRWIGIELNANYAEIARRRTAQQSLLTWSTP